MPVLIENKKINNKYLIYYFKFDRKHNFIIENVEHLLSLDKWLSIDQWIEIYDKLEKHANNYTQNNNKKLKNLFTDKYRMWLEIDWKPLTNELKNVLDLQNENFYDDYIFITIKTVSKFDSYIHSLNDRILDVSNEKEKLTKDGIPKDSINKKNEFIHNNSENKEYEEYIPAGVSSIITDTYKPMTLDKLFKNEEYSPSTTNSDLFGDVSNSPTATYMPNSTNPLQYTPKKYKRQHASTPKHDVDISNSLSSISTPSPGIIPETCPQSDLNTKDCLAEFVNKCKLEHYKVKKRNLSPVQESAPAKVTDNIRSNEKRKKSKKYDLFNDIVDNSNNIQGCKSPRNSKKRFDNLRESKMGTKLYNSKSKQPKIDKHLITQTNDRNDWLQARGGTHNPTMSTASKPSKITSTSTSTLTSLIDSPSKLTTELFPNINNNNDSDNKNIENYSRSVSNDKLSKKTCVENEHEFTANSESSHINLPETYKKIEIFNLKFMTNEQIKGSFKENKSMLKKLIAEYDPSVKLKPPYFMEDICNNEQKIFMLNILQETFFDKNLHGITGPTSILFELLLPEWELSIFMKKFKLTREEAIKRIHVQNEHDDDFSMDSFNMSQ